jgi:hypothetical protein
MESYEVLKKAFQKPGIKKIASELGLSQSLVYKWSQNKAEPEDWQQGGAVNPLDRVKQIYELTGDLEVLNWLCRCADGYYVKNPSGRSADYDAKLLRNIQKIIKEFSEALDVISTSYDDDKHISLKEAEHIRKEWEELKGAGEAFVRACESGRYQSRTKSKTKDND